MKKLTLFIVILSLIAALCACSLEATGDPSTPVDVQTDPAPTSGQTETVPTESTEPAEPWDSNELRAMLPEPPGVGFSYDWSGLSIHITGATIDEWNAYCDTLLSMGFDAYHSLESYSSDGGMQLVFNGRNADGVYVNISTESYDQPGALLWIRDFREVEDPEKAQLWGADEFQQMLPDPGCGFLDTQITEYVYEGQNTRHYVVNLSPAMGYERAKAYAEKLREAGFIYAQTEDDTPFSDRYALTASNGEGYMIYLSVGSELTPALLLFEPGMDGTHRDWDDDYFRCFLPEPMGMDYHQRNTELSSNISKEWTIKGMNYEGAKAYVQALMEKGYTEITIQEDDPDAQTYVFEASGLISKTGEETVKEQWHVRLVFDPSQTLEDGTPMCMLYLSNKGFW